MSDERVQLSDIIEARLRGCLDVLGLGDWSSSVLSLLVAFETEREFALQVRQDDVHGRAGVVPWSLLVGDLARAPEDVAELERALTSLANWGLVQVVGQHPSDPVVPGVAALRLTHSGRVCLGLAPGRRRALRPPGSEAWTILHGASREGMLLTVSDRLGWPVSAIAALNRHDLPGALAGLVAEALCSEGVAVVDGTSSGDARGCSTLEDLLDRTASASGLRLLLVSEPAPFRYIAWKTGARLEWVEPEIVGRRDRVVMDARVQARLMASQPDRSGIADLSGVPDSDIAAPRKVETRWEELVLTERTQKEFDQALMHARFRLEVLPNLGGARGRGPGYRLLLSGLPGTGKSMAAEALANTLGRALVKLDLSSVLSKWLGETEKLLAQVFDVAEASGAVLVLDEAESLLRQRESGASGNSALATGVAYLLTRLDRFGGVLVATTNRTRDLDEAFFRRFDDFIVLPVPDEATRTILWQRMIGEDHATLGVDLPLLARHFAIGGGLIRGASIRARAWALGTATPLSTPLVLASLGRELEKSDRAPNEVLIEPYRAQVQEILGRFSRVRDNS